MNPRAFQQKLERVKRTLAPRDFCWYPYDTFSVFPVLERLVHEDLVALAGAAPVLDIGCGDGDLSFLFESLGCDVRAIENAATNYNHTRGFHALHAALHSSAVLQLADIDAGLDLGGRTFGLALCFGLLYHLKNPFGFLETLARHARHCLLSTLVTEATSEPVAYLLDPEEANHDATNYWMFSVTGLRRLFERTGWELRDSLTVPGHGDQRAFCYLRSRLPDPWPGVDLDGGWHAMEHGCWRWTERVFGVRLAHGGRLRLRFTAPVGIVPFRMRLGDVEREYRDAGEQAFEADVRGGPLRFELDHALTPGGTDGRELGVQVVFWSLAGEEMHPLQITG